MSNLGTQPMVGTTAKSKAPVALNPRQVKAWDLLGSEARHVLLYGGSRAGKTLLIMRAIIIRALAHKSRHAALRFRFNHIKASVVYDTLPNVMEMFFSEVEPHCHLDKSDWFYRLPNGWEIWFGGLDDKERTEKILGQEYSTIFFNECSQIPWSSRNMAITRLAQNTPLRLKAYYDCNPPSDQHWTCRAFIHKMDPDSRQGLRDPKLYAAIQINPADNPHLKADAIDELKSLPGRMRRRFYEGEFGSSADNALWTYELLDRCRMVGGALPDLQRIVIGVDPSGCSGPEETRSDETGIAVVGLGTDGRAYLLEDLSARYGPSEWGKIVSDAYDRHEADCIVAETNYGGAMVGEVLRAARSSNEPRMAFREVKASRGQGKVVRAEPVSTLYAQGKVVHVGYYEILEDQLCAMTTAGFIGARSPDRADALVWAIHDLFPAMTRRESTIGMGRIDLSRLPKVMLGYPASRRRH